MEQSEVLGRQPVLVPQILHKTDLGLNLSFHSKRLETNHMSHYMALLVIYLYVPVYVCMYVVTPVIHIWEVCGLRGQWPATPLKMCGII
jgi:hypothetical protein